MYASSQVSRSIQGVAVAREDGGFAAAAGAASAAPTGLRQQRPDGGAPARDDGGFFDAAKGGTSNAPGAPKWETGGQAGSTDNGYDTPFYATFFAQQQEAADEGKLADLY